jgi:ArsR family transcriptional regulator
MNADYAKQLPPGWERFSRFFFALGDRTRQQILLVFDPSEEICVNDVARLFQLSRPAISHHLKVLRDAGLLISEKRGKEVYYRVNFAHCAEVLTVVQEFIGQRAAGPTASETARKVAAVRMDASVSWNRAADGVPHLAAASEADD